MKKQSILKLALVCLTVLALLMPAALVGAEGETETAGAASSEEAAVSPLTPLGINSGFLIAQIINFGFIFVVLMLALWRPMRNALDSRAATIAKGLEDSAVAANARRDAEAEAERIRQSAQSDIQKSIEEARTRGEDVAKTIEAQARANAEKILADARARAEEERNAELAGLRGQVGAIAIALSQRLIGEALDEKRQQALINDFFAKVPADVKSLSGDVEVISAMPLSDKEQDKVKKETKAANITFSVDPKILGGLIIRSGDHVVDGSVRSGLNELSERLK